MPRSARRRLRASHAVMTFGPGAIADLREESVMLGGLDWWPHGEDTRIHEPNLEAALNVRAFQKPPELDERGRERHGHLPIVLFPEWLVCPQCGRLARYTTLVGIFSGGGRLRCSSCRKPVYPARLVVACRKGHVDDFPWEWWVHEGQGKQCTGKPSLKLRSLGRTASLGDILIRCETCSATRTLAGATFPENIAERVCTGKRPWLRDEEPCREKPVPLQRGASNVYFPILVSSISIPPWSDAIQNVVGRQWDMLERLARNRPDMLEDTVEGLELPQRTGFSAASIARAIQDRLDNQSGPGSEITEAQLRYQEHLALRSPHSGDNPMEEFQTREAGIHERLRPFISQVMLVTRLREVMAIRGFTRVLSPDPSDRIRVTPAPLARGRLPWLPAIEVRGEGLYLELDEGAVMKWEAQHPVVGERAARLQQTYEEMCKQRRWKASRRISPRLLLVHSLAHALVRQLSLECGYSAASLRERLYVFEPGEEQGREGVAGLLIYTATVDSDGSLGGLVRQAQPDRLIETMLGAIEEASWCASDPLCLESEGQGQGALNLAACHACLLVSETSCEEYNRLLDRAMLCGPIGKPEAGYFHGIGGS